MQSNPIDTFLLEADDLLAQIEQSALDVAADHENAEAVNQLFRAFHTIKGSSAMFGFDAVAAFTHHVESALEAARDGERAIDSEFVELLLSARDAIKTLLSGAACDDCARIVSALNVETAASQPAPENAPLEPDTGPEQRFKIRFRPPPTIAAHGMDPLSLLDELRSLGSCNISVDTSDVPPLETIEPDQCYLSWSVDLVGQTTANAIRDVFIFVEDESELSIEAIAEAEAPAAASLQPAPAAPSPVSPALPTRDHPKSAAAAPQSTVRVPSAKLDQLVRLVGELVMNQSRLTQVSNRIENSDLALPVEAIERLVAELRDNVLGIRMMPIGSTFNRFRRLVHDLSLELGKAVELVTEGEDTELDKTVLDQLGDPLVHIIRNCIDHGIESPEKRLRAGKPETGRIRLAATHEGTQVAIAIQDDGRGLDRSRILAKAAERGLVASDAKLSESEIFSLIFHPGFSTAETVSNVSGRGVGMDVVRRQLETLGGAVHVSSEFGRGTTVTLKLPLTLAIIDGLLVEIGQSQFILPMAAVTENVEITAAERSANNGRNLVQVRGEPIPYVRLRELFRSGDSGPDIEKVVITQFEGQRLGFVVDRVLGSHQTVIQSLGRFYQNIEVVSGATIMGDGRVALILDIPGLVRRDAAQRSLSPQP